VKPKQIMFEQYIGDGASTFITIIAVLIGFATALGYIDFLKTKKEQNKLPGGEGDKEIGK
jgi:Na+/alanine symporter